MSWGNLYGPDPPEPEEILCPLCDCDCETIYIDENNEIAGCETCFDMKYTQIESCEWWAKEKEGREADEGDRRYHEMKDEGIN